ncbi:hypothetical protein MM239_20825, partial [Belliella sp. DSM 111904]
EKLTATTIPTTTCDNQGQFIRPSNYKLSQEYLTYNSSNGLLTSSRGRDGINVQVSHIHNGTLIGSKTINPGASAFTESMSYIPLVGVSVKNDPNNISTKYEYDYNNRLRIVRDQDNNIIERNRYHYKNETANFALNSTRSQALINQQITFSIADVVLPTGGTHTISWNMGNGVVYNDNRQSVNISYPNSGLYVVTATMT